MVFFNYALRKLNAKIVYYGPGLCGKTTNLVWIHDHFEGGERGKMISLATEGDRTIFFDLLPIEIGSIRGMDVTLQLYTVPGQVHYNSTRQLVLRGADGVVFVGDSQRAMQSSNIDSFKNLQENLLLQGISLDGFPHALQFNKRDLKDLNIDSFKNLQENLLLQGISLDGFPHALQFNKRDLKDLVPVEELDDELNVYRVPIFEAVATDGIGVQETLEGIVKLVMRSLRERYEGATTGSRTPGVADAAVERTSVSVTETQPGPTAVPTPESPPVAPPPPAAQPPATATPPVGATFSPEGGAETADFAKTHGPETFDGAATGGFEDEVATGVYDLGDEETGALQDLGRPSQPDMAPVAPEPPPEPVPPVASTPDYDLGSTVTDGVPPPSVLEVGGDPFSEIPSDPGMMAPTVEEVEKVEAVEEVDVVEEVTSLEDMEIPDFELDIPSDEKEPEFEAPPVAAEPEVPEFEAAAPSAQPEVPEFADVTPPAEPEIPDFEDTAPSAQPEVSEFEAVVPPAAPEVPEFAATSLSVDPAASGLEVTPPAAEPEISGIEFIPTPDVEDVTQPSERYEDRIEAPSPFAPQASAGAEDAPHVLDATADGDAEAVADVEPAVIVAEVESVIAEAEADMLSDAPPEPVMLENGEPWTEEEITGVLEVSEVEKYEQAAAIEEAGRREVSVSAEDNQLHLRLQGTGAIIESGQVRAIDIEVPVPGAWVGNRRVTLQLRLTLIPDTEDENGGSGSPS